jgi:hypothetical protein
MLSRQFVGSIAACHTIGVVWMQFGLPAGKTKAADTPATPLTESNEPSRIHVSRCFQTLDRGPAKAKTRTNRASIGNQAHAGPGHSVLDEAREKIDRWKNRGCQ